MGQSANDLRLRSPLDWGKEACRSLMETYEPSKLPPENWWHYHQGVFLYGMLKVWEKTGDPNYLEYIKGYVDHQIDAHGNFVTEYRRQELDAIQAGFLLFTLDRETGDPRYKIAARKLRNQLLTLNKTSEGGFWHKDKYPYQMWLDGLYMGGVYSCLYARAYGEIELYDLVLRQEKLMRTRTQDEQTGLLYHAWDESKKTEWSDPDTGRAPEFWGRAIGWYGVAVNDILELVPQHYPEREEMIQALRRLIEGLIRFQDEKTGLWYQVVDKGDREDNWLETSCSSLFVYTIAKAVRNGHVEEKYLDAAIKGYRGLTERIYFKDNGLLVLPDICIGTGVGDYRHYVNRPKSENDLHGVGAFVLASMQMEGIYPESD